MSQNPYTAAEERAHTLTHAIGVAGSLAAIPWLVLIASQEGDAWRLVSGLIFAVSALLLFTTSCLYHSTSQHLRKSRLRVLDHSAIYLLIAGSYTPFTLGLLRGLWGWTLFAVIWSLAVVGILAKTLVGFRFPRLSIVLYLGMGWAGIFAIKPLAERLTGTQLGWIIAGGALYTLGVPFYLWKSRLYTHAIWHLFVLGGVACHFMAVRGVMSLSPG